MKNALIGTSAIVAMFAVAPWVQARTQNTAATHVSDQEFVMNAAKANMAEIELAKLAETRASSDEVKTFARRMVDDHQKALDGLKTIAKNASVTWPTAIDPKDEALKTRLEKLSGHAFDRAYMSAMVKDHQHDVAEFRAEATRAKAADVKQYASSTLPTLEDHLKIAQSTDRSVADKSAKHGTKKPGV